MRIDYHKPGYVCAMHAREPAAAVGIIEQCSAVAVILADDRDMMRAPQHGHTCSWRSAWKSVPTRNEPEITHGMPERLDARTAAAEQARWAAGRVLNDLTTAVLVVRRLRFLVCRTASDNGPTASSSVRGSMRPIPHGRVDPLPAVTASAGAYRGRRSIDDGDNRR
jgi:hypothetical protein